MGEFYSCESGGAIAAGHLLWRDQPIVTAGDSLTEYGSGCLWGLALARSPVRICYNAGVAGNMIDDLWARWATDVAARNPKAVLTRVGTNNVDGASTLDTTAFAASYQPIIDWHVTTNTHGGIHAIPPEVGTPGAAILARNDWLAAQCAAHSSLLKFADDSRALGDAGYNGDYAYMPDGTHMNGWARREQGEDDKPVFQAMFGTADVRLLDANDNHVTNPASTQYVKNPHMAGTTGGKTNCTGTVATDYSVICSAGSSNQADIIAADVGDPVQVPWQRITPQSGAVNDRIMLQTYLSHPAFTSSIADMRSLDAIAEVRFVGFDASKFKWLLGYVTSSENGGTQPSGMLALHMEFPKTLNEAIIFRQSLDRDRPYNTLYGHSANTFHLDLMLDVAVAFASSPGSIDFRCISVRKRT